MRATFKLMSGYSFLRSRKNGDTVVGSTPKKDLNHPTRLASLFFRCLARSNPAYNRPKHRMSGTDIETRMLVKSIGMAIALAGRDVEELSVD